ncbi:lambda exonuclease family protein [Arthrobacter sp. MA-N2]|uniref:lambda exonuclease family protein n=1 Tax=Arthrobacter sp. MA-N2 TaxID=1101188 RepID=UPI000485A41B|nr:lambda exonuclease family protein [Arthrobacter sp. MA-N2]
MSLQIFKELEQGSDEWLAARCGIVTASVVGQLVTTKTLKPAANETARGLTATLVAERITGHVEPMTVSRDMERGTLDEPYAREIYAEHYAPVAELGFMVRDDWGFKIGYSPDGLVGDDGLIEIKSRKQKIQLNTILADEVPIENMAQIQCGLLVSGRKWCDYVSFCGGMPLYVKRVSPDERWREAIIESVSEFEMSANAMLARYAESTEGLPMTERIDHYAELELKL